MNTGPVDPRWQTLPPGWSTATSALDGRIYYWDKSTGRTSWTHPMATPIMMESTRQEGRRGGWAGFQPWEILPSATRTEYHDTPWNASRRPNNHQCSSMGALVLCPPLGVCAVYQSFAVDQAWADGRYGDAVNHSRQASQYSGYGNFLGFLFWVWYFFSEELRRIPDWFASLFN